MLMAAHGAETLSRQSIIAQGRQALQHGHWARARDLAQSRTPSGTGNRGGTTMQLASMLFPWAQGQSPSVGTPVRTPVTRRRRGGSQPPDQEATGGLPTECHHAAFHTLDMPWKRSPAQSQAPTTEGCLDSLARTHPALCLLLYSIQ